MDNQLNNHEKEFKKVLEGISFDINTSDVWHDIKDRLPLEKKKEKKPFWLFFSLGLGLVLLSSFAMYAYLVNGNSAMDVDTIAFNKAPINDAEVISQDITYTNENNANISNPITNINTTESVSNKDQLLTQVLIKNNKYNKASNSSDLNSLQLMSIDDFNKQDNTERNRSILNTNSIDNSIIKSVSISHDIITQPSGLIQLLAMLSYSAEVPSVSLDYDNSIIPLVNIQDDHRFFGSLRSGGNIGFSTNTLVGLNGEFDSAKFDNESSRIGISNDILLGLETSKGWRLFGGVSHTNEVYNYRNQNIETSQLQEDGIQSNHIDAQGVVTSVTGPVTVNRTTSYDQSWHRRHESIAMNVGVGKRIPLFDRISVVPEVSLQYNISQEVSGYYFSEDNADIEYFSSNESNPYTADKFLKYRAGLGVDYNLNNVSIGILGTYIYNPNNYLQESNFYQSRSDLISLQFSLSYFPNW